MIHPFQSGFDVATQITLARVIDLVGGLLLIVTSYFLLIARRTDESQRRRRYRRRVLQLVTGFFVFAYATALFAPGKDAWPVAFGKQLYGYFASLETTPTTIDTQLTGMFEALVRQLDAATGSTGESGSIVNDVETGIRTIGLVIYATFFSLASVGVQVPRRVVAGIGNWLNDED